VCSLVQCGEVDVSDRFEHYYQHSPIGDYCFLLMDPFFVFWERFTSREAIPDAQLF